MENINQFSDSEMSAIQDLKDCLHHSRQHRSKYQCVINCLRVKVIPKKYVRKLASRICLCKTSGDYLDEIMKGVTDLSSKLKSVPSNASLKAALESSNLNPEVYKQTSDIMREMENSVSINKSTRRFFFLLHSALEGNFEYMDPPKPDEEEKKKKEKKITITKTFLIPLRTTYVPFLIGKKGVYLNALTKKLGCKIQLIRPKGYAETTECKVTALSNDALLLAEETMVKKAKETEEKRKIADQKTVEYYKRKATRQTTRLVDRTTRPAITVDAVKEGNRNTFTVKHQHQQYDTGKSQARPKPPPVLEEGSRCINCLTPYTSEKLKDTKCQYHPGFIAEKEDKVLSYKYAKNSNNIEVQSAGKQIVIMSEKMWSCCDEKMIDLSIESQEKSHSQTGCVSGLHNWRPTRKSSKKSSTNKVTKGHGTSNSMPKLKKSAQISEMQIGNEDDEEQVDDIDVDVDDYKPPSHDVSLADYLQKTI